MLPAPILPLIGPLLLAAVMLSMIRWPKIASATGGTLLFGYALWVGRLDLIETNQGFFSGDTFVFLGRSLQMTSSFQNLLVLTSLALGILYLFAVFLPQDPTYHIIGLAVLSPLSGALMADPPVFGVILYLVAAGFLAIFIQGGRAGSTLSALRFLIMAILASMILLVADWMDSANQTAYAVGTARLFSLAFVILLAGFPFHIWIAPLVNESTSLIPGVAVGLTQLLVIYFCIGLLQTNPALRVNLEFNLLLRMSGLIAIVLAAFLALTVGSYGRLLGYVLLLDTGSVLIALSFPGGDGFQAALSIGLMRIFGLILAGVGLGLLRRQMSPDEVTAGNLLAGRGLVRMTPIGTALYLFGGLSLAGAPLTPGFFGRWSTVALIAEESSWQGTLVIIAVIACTLALIRGLIVLLDTSGPVAESQMVQEHRLLKVASTILLVAGAILTLFPQLLLDRVAGLIELL